jgi:hypothetical protein
MTYSDIMGADNLYSIRGNALDIRGGCTLDGMSIPCSELQERMERGWVEMEYMYPAVAPGQPSLNTPGEPVTILRTERFPILSLGLGMFMTGFPVMAGGPVGPGNNNEGYYLSWRSDVFRFSPQKSVKEDNPSELQGENNGKDCGVVVTFKPGTTNPTTGLPNGPSTITYNGQPNFGLGFSVNGWVSGGGIGTIGVNEKTGKKVPNPQNPKGRWSLEQWTHSWIGQNGKTIVEKQTFPDLHLNSAGLKVDGNTFSYYDHPGGPPPSAGFGRYDNYLIKVYSGKTVCEVGFHFIQHGNTIRWGRGLL